MGVYLGHDKVANGGFIGDYDSLPVGSVIEFDGNEVPVGYEEVEDVNINEYSTEEIVVGKWFGKPIYRKVVNFSKTSLQSLTYIPTGITNMECLVRATGSVLFSGTIWIPMPFYNLGGFNSFHVTDYGQNIMYEEGAYNATQVHFILEYTKTTD